MFKIPSSIAVTVLVALVGCDTMGGPRPPTKSWQPHQQDVNAMADCESNAPNIRRVYDPLTGYYVFEGADAEKNRQCLKTKYGWFELEPPEWTPGTMAPPR